MPILDRLRERRRDKLTEGLHEAVQQRDSSLSMLYERIAELELALEDEGWIRLGLEGEREFSRSGLQTIVKLARLYYLKNPLIRRGVNVQKYYVFGQGVEIGARSEVVNAVVQRFLDDPVNQRSLVSHQARQQREQDLQTDGNVFFALFHNTSTGHVRVHPILVDEIQQIISNPDDRDEPWLYRRIWTQESWDFSTGTSSMVQREALYPDWRYTPETKPPTSGSLPVYWDTPLYHVKVGGTSGMRFGVPDVYAGLDWARAYKEFLEDFASIAKSLARFAWKLTSKRQKVSTLKSRFGTTASLDQRETNPPPTTGSMFIGNEGDDLRPIPKTGANLSLEEGRAIRTMVAAALDVPDTILAGDPDMGNLATAKTLDRPTELAMQDRQTTWAGVYRDLLTYALQQSVIAPNGIVDGSVTTDDDGITKFDLGMEELPPDADPSATPEPVNPTIDVNFPPILEQDIGTTVDAVVTAATLDGKADAGTMPNETRTRLLLSALGVQDIDDVLETMRTEREQGVPEPGAQPSAEAAFHEAVNDLREAVRALA